MLVMTKDKRNMEQIQWKKGYPILCYAMLHDMQMKLKGLLLVLANKVSGYTFFELYENTVDIRYGIVRNG
jgi:hypothetical protein